MRIPASYFEPEYDPNEARRAWMWDELEKTADKVINSIDGVKISPDFREDFGKILAAAWNNRCDSAEMIFEKGNFGILEFYALEGDIENFERKICEGAY